MTKKRRYLLIGSVLCAILLFSVPAYAECQHEWEWIDGKPVLYYNTKFHRKSNTYRCTICGAIEERHIDTLHSDCERHYMDDGSYETKCSVCDFPSNDATLKPGVVHQYSGRPKLKMVINSEGILKIDSSGKMRLYDSDDNVYDWNIFKGETYWRITPGVYYITPMENNYNYYPSHDIKYTVIPKNKPVNTRESKAQFLKKNAIDYMQFGTLKSRYNMNRWYKIKLTKKQKINIRIYGMSYMPNYYIFDKRYRELPATPRNIFDGPKSYDKPYVTVSTNKAYPKGTYYIDFEFWNAASGRNTGHAHKFKWY